VSTVNLA